MRVLIVDDDDFALTVLESTLGRMGYTAVRAHDGNEAIEILRKGEIRLMVTDWDMPGMNGIDLSRAVRSDDLPGYVYIIMLTGREGAKHRLEGLCAGTDDFLNKPLDPEELLVCLKTAERILSLETRDVALFALAKLAESRDSDTGAHIERVQAYTRIVARSLSTDIKQRHGVDDEYVRLLYQTSPLHDLGKVGIPDAILLKPGRLTSDEFAVMKTHTLIGAETLDSALHRFPNVRFLQMARDIALSHHERFDGSGYPNSLAGEQIPFCARIVAIADVYDALTSRRVYKGAAQHEEARRIILSSRGSHFDSDVVDAFIRAEEQIKAVRDRLQDDAEPATPKPMVACTPSIDRHGSPQATILVVEDDPVLLKQLLGLLASTGESVLHATSGAEAMEIIAKRTPQVVVADWVMPQGDGMELCRHIRACGSANPIHFIMLTAHSDKARLLEAYNAGVDDFVSKPFDAEELLARVRAGLRTVKLHDELSHSANGSRALNAQLATVNSRLERLAITDELTGLFNRRHAMLRLEEQWVAAERFSQSLTVAIVDVDHFKRINDMYGHHTGDVILRRMAEVLRTCSRATDVVCRIGGEEFLLIFPGQTIQEASLCAERCRVSAAEQALDVQGETIKATISVGIATRMPGTGQFTDLMKFADEALYVAKASGRNTIRIAEQTRERPDMIIPSNDVPSAKPPVDLDAVLQRCGGDAKFAQAVIARFRDQAGCEVERIDQGLKSGALDIVRRAAHTLKSMAAYMGSDAIVSIAKRTEELSGQGMSGELWALHGQLRDEVERAVRWLADNTGCPQPSRQ